MRPASSGSVRHSRGEAVRGGNEGESSPVTQCKSYHSAGTPPHVGQAGWLAVETKTNILYVVFM